MPTEERIPFQRLAEIDFQSTAFLFGVLPALVLGAIAVISFVLWLYRRARNFSRIGEAMRLEDGQDFPGDEQLANMPPTEPSQRLKRD